MRVPGSPKPRTPSPSRAQRLHLRPLLLANRARTTLPRPALPGPTLPQPTLKRWVISSPRNYKSAADRIEQGAGGHNGTGPPSIPTRVPSITVPEIKVTPPIPSPTMWGRGTRAALDGIEVPERSSSLDAVAVPSVSNNPGFANVDHRFLDPHYGPPPPQVPPPIPPRNSPWHHHTTYNPHPSAPLSPRAPRRVARMWDRNFMPTTSQPGARQPITNPSRERIVRQHDEEIGRAI